MIYISDLKDLLYIVPDLITMFLPGFFFMITYMWLNNKNIDVALTALWSLFVSYVIRIVYSVLHGFILINTFFDDSVKILIYLITGILGAIIITVVMQTNTVNKILKKINHKSINDDVFNDIIDYDKLMILQISLKTCNNQYIGRFVMREEKGLDSWIVLADYFKLDKNTKKELYCPSDHGQKSTVAINLNDVESIEILYQDDSEVWRRISETDVNEDTQ